jgi:hypothetical protein
MESKGSYHVHYSRPVDSILSQLNPVGTLSHSLPKCYHLDMVGGPSTPHDPESDAGGSLSSWQGHPSR